ncbi:hydrolase [Bacteroidia bacterium]|nr:hydrolase [Bacteroidia bacterium]
MQLTFLGTGTSQGVPMIACDCKVCQSDDPRDKRLRTSALLQTDDLTIVIDAGPDFRQQMLRRQVKRLDAVVLTHEHKDHVGGLDDVRAFNYFMQRPMPIYAEPRVMTALHREYAYAFAENKYSGVPEMDLHPITEAPFFIKKTKIIPIRGLHCKLPVLGFRIDDMVYLTDMNAISDESMQSIKGCKSLVINALRKEPHGSHFTLAQALKIIDTVKPQQAFLTHISHQLGQHADVQNELPANVFLAYDGLTIEN